jgi:Flp pilus assembly pilin Flp
MEVNARSLWSSIGHPSGLACGVVSLLGVDGMESLIRFIREDEGQDVVEYGLLIATIAIVVLIGVGVFGNNINAWFQHLAARITTVGT